MTWWCALALGDGEAAPSEGSLHRTLCLCGLGQLFISGAAACSSVNKGQFLPYRAIVKVLEVMDRERYWLRIVFILIF